MMHFWWGEGVDVLWVSVVREDDWKSKLWMTGTVGTFSMCECKWAVLGKDRQLWGAEWRKVNILSGAWE